MPLPLRLRALWGPLFHNALHPAHGWCRLVFCDSPIGQTHPLAYLMWHACLPPPHTHTPHTGRYDTSSAGTPSGMQVQKLLAGMRDRGATCAVVECSDAGLQAGHLRFVDLAVAVHTNFSGAGADHELFEGDKEKVLEAQLELFETLLDETAQVGMRGENAGPLAITLRGGGGGALPPTDRAAGDDLNGGMHACS